MGKHREYAPTQWTAEMDDLLLFMVEMLGTSQAFCAGVMSREYPGRAFTIKAVGARKWRLHKKRHPLPLQPARFHLTPTPKETTMTTNNSTQPSSVGGVSGERLKQLIERIERLEEEKSGIAEDIRDVYAEAKSAGFETKIMREIVKLRKMDNQKRQEVEELLELYKSAIGLE